MIFKEKNKLKNNRQIMSNIKNIPEKCLKEKRKKEENVEIDRIDIFNTILNFSIKEKKNKFKPNSIYKDIRINGINIIKNFCNSFQLDQKIFYSSVYLMDDLFINKKFTQEICKTAYHCILICLKFFENGTFSLNIINNLKKEDFDYNLEIEILKSINYNLNFFTAYDILTFLINNQILFSYEKEFLRIHNIEISNVYYNCFIQLYKLIDKKFYIRFTSIEYAFSLIAFIRKSFGLEDLNIIFGKIYNYQYENYSKCFEFLITKLKAKNISEILNKKIK